MVDTPEQEPDDAFVTAGELSLGVLDGAELAAARERQLTDRAFGEAVEWWHARLGAMAEATPAFLPSATVWSGIDAAIDRIQSQDATVAPMPEPRRPVAWSIMSALAGAAAASIAFVLFFDQPQPMPTPQPPELERPQPQLITQAQDEAAGRRLAGIVDATGRRLSLKIDGFQPEEGQAPELWVIPAGGEPVSLGFIPAQGDFARDLTAEEARLLVEGATLAVTFEEDSGAPHEAPTPPILVTGSLDQV